MPSHNEVKEDDLLKVSEGFRPISAIIALIIAVCILMVPGQGANCTIPVQGTAFDEGAVIASDDVTITVHDAITAGSQLHTQTFTGAISVSRFDVAIEGFDCDYGQVYYVDATVAGTDVDWGSTSHERQPWVAWAGEIGTADITIDGNLDMNSNGLTEVDHVTSDNSDLAIIADAANNIAAQLGDDAAATAFEIRDSGAALVATIDSNGAATVTALEVSAGGITGVGTVTAFSNTLMSFVSDAGDNIRSTLGDAAGTNEFEFYDSTGSNEVGSVDSDGNLQMDGTCGCNAVTGDGSGLTGITSSSITVDADIAFGSSYHLTGLAAGASAGDSVRYEQVFTTRTRRVYLSPLFGTAGGWASAGYGVGTWRVPDGTDTYLDFEVWRIPADFASWSSVKIYRHATNGDVRWGGTFNCGAEGEAANTHTAAIIEVTDTLAASNYVDFSADLDSQIPVACAVGDVFAFTQYAHGTHADNDESQYIAGIEIIYNANDNADE